MAGHQRLLGPAGLYLSRTRTDIVPMLHDDLAMVLSGFAAALVVTACAVGGRAFAALL